MGEKSDQIERHIQEQRAELGDNIVQLQEKVKGAFDCESNSSTGP